MGGAHADTNAGAVVEGRQRTKSLAGHRRCNRRPKPCRGNGGGEGGAGRGRLASLDATATGVTNRPYVERTATSAGGAWGARPGPCERRLGGRGCQPPRPSSYAPVGRRRRVRGGGCGPRAEAVGGDRRHPRALRRQAGLSRRGADGGEPRRRPRMCRQLHHGQRPVTGPSVGGGCGRGTKVSAERDARVPGGPRARALGWGQPTYQLSRLRSRPAGSATLASGVQRAAPAGGNFASVSRQGRDERGHLGASFGWGTRRRSIGHGTPPLTHVPSHRWNCQPRSHHGERPTWWR